jgi:hypothetical protein
MRILFACIRQAVSHCVVRRVFDVTGVEGSEIYSCRGKVLRPVDIFGTLLIG